MTYQDRIDPPNPPLSPEQQAIVSSLTDAFVHRIDATLLSHAMSRPRKVAMLVMMTMGDPELSVPGLPDLFYAQRVRELVKKGLLLSEGNLDFMQYSEVRLP